MKLVVATHNQNKFKEIKHIINIPTLKLLSLRNYPKLKSPIETGHTYKDNALIKAKYAASKLSQPILAEDSGLEIRTLQKKPGVRSKRFVGINVSDHDRNKKIIAMMKHIPNRARHARFICHAVLQLPNHQPFFTKGIIHGKISFAPKGKNGFGYDPIFIPHGFKGKTMAELSKYTKNKHSHRAIAMLRMKILIMQLFKNGGFDVK